MLSTELTASEHPTGEPFMATFNNNTTASTPSTLLNTSGTTTHHVGPTQLPQYNLSHNYFPNPMPAFTSSPSFPTTQAPTPHVHSTANTTLKSGGPVPNQDVLPTKQQNAASNSGSQIYSAIYSGVPVYEMMCRNVAVMRRRADSYLNATQILKVAGIDKGRRTKILEKEIMNGEHEKVQGGYGKYQGTWIPYERGVQLAQIYQVDQYLRNILEFDPPSASSKPIPKKPQTNDSQNDAHGDADMKKQKRASFGNAESSKKRQKMSSDNLNHENGRKDSGRSALARSTSTLSLSQESDVGFGPERHRAALMAIFLNDDPNFVPELLSSPNPPSDLDVDLVIDEQGHTALHWAAALAKINVLKRLVAKNANVLHKNCNGETALIRAVLVTNNFDNQTFQDVVDLLSSAIYQVDHKNRTILHHIALSAGVKGRSQSSRYYMECVLERIARQDGDFSRIVDIQDKSGDTALNIAARIGNRNLVEQLLDVGADPTVENRAGLRPCDFGIDAYTLNSKKGKNSESTGLDRIIVNEDPVHSNNASVGGPFEMVPLLKDGIAAESEPCKESDQETKSNLPSAASSCSNLPVYSARVVFPTIRTDKDDQPVDTLAVDVEHFVQPSLKNKSREIADVVHKMVESMSQEYMNELKVRVEGLRESQGNLRDVTRELSQVRRTNALLKGQNSKIPELLQRIQNLESCLSEEMAKNAELAVEKAMDVTTPACFMEEEDNVEALKKRLALHMEIEKNLRQDIVQLKGQAGENELKYRKIISVCAGVPLHSVDELMDSLLAAVESDETQVNVSELAGFMTRVKSQESCA